MYIDTYRNSFAVDVLEYFKLVKLKQEVPFAKNVSEESSLRQEQVNFDDNLLEKQDFGDFGDPSKAGDIDGAVEQMHGCKDTKDQIGRAHV